MFKKHTHTLTNVTENVMWLWNRKKCLSTDMVWQREELERLKIEGMMMAILTEQAENCHLSENLEISYCWFHSCQSHSIQHIQPVDKRHLSHRHYLPVGTKEDSHLWHISKLKRLQGSCLFCQNLTERRWVLRFSIQLSSNWNSSHIITQMGRAASPARNSLTLYPFLKVNVINVT